MKHSIRTKIMLMLTTMVIITILITWFINSAFLEDFYMKRKLGILNDAYSQVANIYKSNGDYNLTEDYVNQIVKLESKYDLDIVVLNSQRKTIFPDIKKIGERDIARAEDFEKESMGFNNPNLSNERILKNEDNILIVTCYDTQYASTFIDFWGKLEIPYVKDSNAESVSGAAGSVTVTPNKKDTTSGNTGNPDNRKNNSEGNTSESEVTGESEDNSSKSVEITPLPQKPPFVNPGSKIGHVPEKKDVAVVILRSNTGSIRESVKIANEFLAYIGFFTAILGSIAVFIITKRFTKPILILSGIAKKMSDLNFEVKYKVITKDEIGELGSSINVLSDKLETTIMELKHANNELMTDIQRKTEIDEMRKEFLSNVSHELKTPIALIQGYAEGLKENINDDEESRDYYCEVIMDEANKMNNMVKKLLSLNELEFGNNQVNFERFDIVSLIKSVLISTEILIKQKEVTLLFEQTEPIYVWADELLIEQVVTNYISNALNHVDGQKIIEIKLIPRGESVRVAVFNTGNNIPEEDLDKIWIKFYKVDKARTREYGGSGIGLSIVKAIMNSHNKEFGVINRHIGVEFWFELDTKS